jgi:thiol-disulfide isomerase/thioredoxin
MFIRSPRCMITFIIAATLTSLTGGCAVSGSYSERTADLFDNALREVGLEQAHQIAAAENRMLLVFGTANWCGPCRYMKATTWNNPRVLDWVEHHAVLYYLDLDVDRSMSAEVQVTAIPAVVAFRNGEELGRIVGAPGANRFLAWLNGLDE